MISNVLDACELCGRKAKLGQVILGKTCPPARLCRICRNSIEHQERVYGPKLPGMVRA